MKMVLATLTAIMLVFALTSCNDIKGSNGENENYTYDPNATPQFVAPTIDINSVHGVSVDKSYYFFGETLNIYVRSDSDTGKFANSATLFVVPEDTANTEEACKKYCVFSVSPIDEVIYSVLVDDTFQVGECQIRVYDENKLLHNTPLKIGNIAYAPEIGQIVTEGFARFDVAYAIDAAHTKDDVLVRMRIDGGEWHELSEYKVRDDKITLFNFLDKSKKKAREKYPETMELLSDIVITYKNTEGKSRCYVDATNHLIEVSFAYDSDAYTFWTTPFILYKST